MSKLARLPTNNRSEQQVDKQIEKSITDLIREINDDEAERMFLKKRLEDEIRTVLDTFAKELAQVQKLRKK